MQSMSNLGGLEACPPENFEKSHPHDHEIESESIFLATLHYLITLACIQAYFPVNGIRMKDGATDLK